MAHFISNVTQQRLSQRGRSKSPTQYVKGIRCISEFTAHIRCMEVLRENNNSQHHQSIWTGNQDGSISIRKGLYGHDGEEISTIERKKGAFVYCLLQTGNNMWIGFSDGYLRVYSVASYEMLNELKMHTAGISSIIQVNGNVFTAGFDWQIMQWEVEDSKPVLRSQFSGHQNAVRCLATDGNVLYSGSDDYTIRCWHVDLGQERSSPWPLYGHRGSVRTMCVVDIYLFSGSEDGTLKVWNTQTAQLVRNLVECTEGSIYTLMKDDSCSRIWAGNTEGIITVWNVLTLGCLATLTDHAGSSVGYLHGLMRLNATKVWFLVKDGRVSTWINEATGNLMNEIASHCTVQEEIDSMRAQLIENFSELETRRKALSSMEAKDSSRKVLIATALSMHDLKNVQYSSFVQWVSWLSLRKKYRQCDAIMTVRAAFREQSKALWYFNMLASNVVEKKTRIQQKKIGKHLQQVNESMLKTDVLSKLVSYSNFSRCREIQLRMIRSREQSIQKRTIRPYFRVWYQVYLKRFHRTKHQRSAEFLSQQLENYCKSKYLSKWVMVYKGPHKRTNGTELITFCTQFRFLFRFWRSWISFVMVSQQNRMREQQANTFVHVRAIEQRNLCYVKLRDYVLSKRSISDANELESIQTQISELQSTIHRFSMMGTTFYEQDLIRRQENLSASESSVRKLGELAQQQERDVEQLRLYVSSGIDLNPNKPLQVRLDIAKGALKSLVNCNTHFEILTTLHCSCKPEDGKMVLVTGVNRIATICKRTDEAKAPTISPRPNDDDVYWWGCPSGTISHIVSSRRLYETVILGIFEIIYALDVVSVTSPSQSQEKLENDFIRAQKEFISNFTTLYTLMKAPPPPKRTNLSSGSSAHLTRSATLYTIDRKALTVDPGSGPTTPKNLSTRSIHSPLSKTKTHTRPPLHSPKNRLPSVKSTSNLKFSSLSSPKTFKRTTTAIKPQSP